MLELIAGPEKKSLTIFLKCSCSEGFVISYVSLFMPVKPYEFRDLMTCVAGMHKVRTLRFIGYGAG